MIPRQTKAVTQIALHRMPLVAIVLNGNAIFGRGEFDRGAMLVGCTDRQCLVAACTAEPRKDVGRQHRADEIAQMLDAVDARDGTGD